MRKVNVVFQLALIASVLLSSCAAGMNPANFTPAPMTEQSALYVLQQAVNGGAKTMILTNDSGSWIFFKTIGERIGIVGMNTSAGTAASRTISFNQLDLYFEKLVEENWHIATSSEVPAEITKIISGTGEAVITLAGKMFFSAYMLPIGSPEDIYKSMPGYSTDS